jgi:histidinol phosphatase-like enzyme
MKFVFDLDGVICTPPKGIQFGIIEYIEKSKPIVNAIEFIQWLHKDHEIIIWTNRPNDLAVKFATEQWLDFHQVKYNRLLFDRPDDAIYVNETPSNAKYFAYDDDVKVVAELFEEWKQEWKKNDRQQEQRSGDTR